MLASLLAALTFWHLLTR